MSEFAERKENKMGTMPIKRLLITMSLPMVISMLVQALYNIVDSIYVAQINENALAAVSLAFPVQNLMIAVGSGAGVGINALLSKNLGEKKYEDANRAATNGIFIVAIGYLFFAAFGIFLSKAFFVGQTDNEQIITYGTQYLSICTTFSFSLFMQMTLERLLMSTGNTLYSMISQATGAIVNIILDPIFIFGYFGVPKLGVAGAAIATVIGQTVGMCLALYLNITRNKEIHIHFKNFIPHGKTIKSIFSVAIPSTIMISIGSVMTYGLNNILLLFTPVAVSVFGVYFKLQSFIFMPVFGLNNGLIPIIAYNYGARNKKRILSALRLSIVTAVVIMLIGLLVFQIFPKQLLYLFNASEDMIKIGVPALRIISLSFIFAGFCIVMGALYQALGQGLLSMIVSIGRQLIIILPIAYLFAKVFGLDAVWYSIPLAELLSVVLNLIFLKYIYNKKIKNLA